MKTSAIITLTARASGGNAQADWNARATALGVTFAYDCGAQAWWSGAWHPFDFNAHKFGNGLQTALLARVVQDTSDGVTGQCLRIDTPAAASDTSPALVLPLNGAWTSYTQGFGATPFWITCRFKIPQSRLTKSSPGSGWKFLNVAGYDPQNITGHSPSNLLYEHVLVDLQQYGFLQAYTRTNSGDYPQFMEPYQSYDYKFQNKVDNGAGLPDAQRYCLYSARPSSPGCVHWTADEWLSVKMRVKIQTYGGSTGNEFDAWYARRDATAWQWLISARNYLTGSDSDFTGGFNGMHPSAYETGRVSSTVDTYQKWCQFIVSTADIALPAVGS